MSNNYYGANVETIKPLLNGSSPNMNVDGDPTPVNFDYAPGSTEIFEIKRIYGAWITNGNVNRPDRFMSINSDLDNGVLATWNNDSVTTELFNLQTNFDIMRLLNGLVRKNELGSRDHFLINHELSSPIILDGTKGDFFRVSIRDDIDSLEECGFSLVGFLSEA